MKITKPKVEDYPPYFGKYIDTINDDDLLVTLEQNGISFRQFIAGLTEEKMNFRYAEGKWTIKEMLLHIIDTERIMCYRAALFLEIYDQPDALRIMKLDNKVNKLEEVSIRILPNPAKNSIKITGLDAFVKGAEIFDARGIKVSTLNRLQLQRTIDISALSPGLYRVVFYNDKSAQTISFAVIK